MKTDQIYRSYRVTRVVEIPEIDCVLTELVHEPTGAQILHIGNEDEENCFNLSFQTLPENSKGVAHILEHTALCGSQKYPIRDPFFGMSRRSLNSFMNAMTGGDFTCYPTATQIEKDFYNLLEVYLDAVFHPILSKKSFLQEGHRLEFENPLDPQSPLVYKGIVYNEMKGAMATGEARLNEFIMEAIFPDITYGKNSGGDPKEIPNLTYEELKAFHEKFYHPSRCLFYFYGNLPLEKHLDFLEEHAFKGFQKISPLPPLSPQPRFSTGVEKTYFYPIAEEEGQLSKTIVGMGWLTCSILNQEELLALDVLDIVLMGTDASPLKMALLKSNLCKQADSLMDNDMSEVPFLLFCKGCEENAADGLEEVVRETLHTVATIGIPDHLIEGAIHQLEFSRTEITGNSTPYGLSLFFRSALLKQHGGNPEDGLRIHTLFNRLRENIKQPNYFGNLINKHFLQNTHFVKIVMHPDQNLGKKEVEEEEQKLKSIRDSLQEKDIQILIEQARELAASQEEDEEENLDILPKVSLSDVAKKGKEFHLHEEQIGTLKVFNHPCFTNEITYAELIFQLPQIIEEDLPYLRLFSLLLPQMGCGGRDYKSNLDYLLEHTGGIGLTLDLSLQADDPSKMSPSLSLRGKALYRKLDKLFSLLRDMVISVDFTDRERLKELLMQHFHGLENSIDHNSLRYAIYLAASGLSIPSKIVNHWYGLDYYWKIKEVVTAFDQNPDTLIAKLEELQKSCLGLKDPHLVLGCDHKTFHELKSEAFFGLCEIPTNAYTPWKAQYSLFQPSSQGRITASPVAFTAMLFPSLPYTHADAPVLSIASEIMENKVLHKRIREQGGAYGGGATNNLLSGHFYFYSYRDPHLASTLKAFQEAANELAKGQFEIQDIEEAKLGLFQDLDSPIAPGSRSITAYSRLRGGRTPERRQAFREKLIQTDKKQIQQAAKHYLLPGIASSTIVSFASQEFFDKENAVLDKKALPTFSV